MTDGADGDIAVLRAFNRLYTARIGLLEAHLDGSAFTLSEARILYELAHRENPTAAEIARALTIDRAQISRTLKRFAQRGLIEAREDPCHGRQQHLALTSAGREAFGTLDRQTQTAVGALLASLPLVRRRRLVRSAAAMTKAFATEQETAPAVTLRGLAPGDLGLVAARQAILYAREYGWNQEYEALVSRILADFHDGFDEARDAAWIAEIDGEMAGSIFLMRGSKPGIAQLRLLYVEPDARGAGVGQRLVETCIERARNLGYRELRLWTVTELAVARRIYQRFGFSLVDEAPDRRFGRDLVSQTWSLGL